MSVYSQLEKLCAARGLSMNSLADEIGANRATFTGWKRGAKPSNVMLKKVADYFDVTVDWLMSDEPVPGPYDVKMETSDFGPLTSMEKQLLDIFRNVSEIGKMRIASAALNVFDIEFNGDPVGDKM